jgi:hypothetical protein
MASQLSVGRTTTDEDEDPDTNKDAAVETDWLVGIDTVDHFEAITAFDGFS